MAKGVKLAITGTVVDKPDESPRYQLIFRGANRENLDAFIAGLGAGIQVDVVLTEHADKRSVAQNNSYWGLLVGPLAEALGYDKQEIGGPEEKREFEHSKYSLHEGLLMRYAGTHRDPATGMMVANKRSSEMNTVEYSEFMAWVVRFAATEHKVVLKLPNEEW